MSKASLRILKIFSIEIKKSLRSLRLKTKSTFNPNSAIEKKEYFSILISNCVAVEKNKR